jgi:RNA-directed DNA polymerase
MAYFRLTETKNIPEALDGWVRRKLRCILWRQWKRPYTRAKNLMKAGLTEEKGISSTRAMVEQWCKPHEPSSPKVLL